MLCVVCGEFLTIPEEEHFNSGLGAADPWCINCIQEEDRRMVEEENIGFGLFRTLPRYLVPIDEW